MNACRNATTIQSEHRGAMVTCPCSPEADGRCACTATATIGHDRNICGCWPEPPAPRRVFSPVCRSCKRPRLSRYEWAHGYQCSDCTARDEGPL